MLNRTIKIQNGFVEGVPCGNPAYTVFKGIPYAKPPIGDNRWKAPVEPESWDEIKKCDTFAPISVQRDQIPGQFYQKEFYPVDDPMSEDCLYLNVWTPSINECKKLPVMMWIHGGAFTGGFGHEMEFDGEAFCKRDVILVTINYRLGALGFFAHPELSKRSQHKVSGNYGILDQIQALKWINKNIAAFGGDPSNVTIFGQSAGGASVQAIIASPLSKGLFHKAIVQSAGGIKALGGKYLMTEAEVVGEEICKKSGKSIDELMQLHSKELCKLIDSALMGPQGFPMMKMIPNVDGYVLPDDPGDALAFGKYPDIQFMTGSVSGDGLLFGGWPSKNKEEFEISAKLMYGKYSDRYLKLFNLQNEIDLERVQSERAQAASMLLPRCWAKAQIKNRRKPIYIYYFNRDIPGEDHPGAFHSSELWYIFGTLNRCWRPMDAVDYKLSLVMTEYWTNFAKKGDPNGKGLPAWSAYDKENPLTMVLNENQIKAVDLNDEILDGMTELLFEEVLEAKSKEESIKSIQ